MALQITESCVNCWACVDVCPNDAIYEDRPHFLVDDNKCTECLGDHSVPQCAAICPIEMAIVNELGEFLNPPGSLTGIPMAELALTVFNVTGMKSGAHETEIAGA